MGGKHIFLAVRKSPYSYSFIRFGHHLTPDRLWIIFYLNQSYKAAVIIQYCFELCQRNNKSKTSKKVLEEKSSPLYII